MIILSSGKSYLLALIAWQSFVGVQDKEPGSHVSSAFDVCVSPNGKIAASAHSTSAVMIWDLTTWKQVRRLDAKNKAVQTCRFSRDGKRLAAGGGDGVAIVWKVETWERETALDPCIGEVHAIEFTSDNKRLICGYQNGEVIEWDVSSGKVMNRFKAHSKLVSSMSLSSDGRLLATGSWDGITKIWGTEDWKEKYTHDTNSTVYNVRFAPNGESLAIGEQRIRIWRFRDRETIIFGGHSDAVTAVAFTTDGERLLSAGEDRKMKIWNATSGKELLSVSTEGCRPTAVVISRDQEYFLCAGLMEPPLWIGDMKSGKLIRRLDQE